MSRFLRVTHWLRVCLPIIAFCTAIVFASGCGMDGFRTPTATPYASEEINPKWFVPPSLDEQIFRSKVIVRASLKSATSTTETIPSQGVGVSPTHRPVQELRFTIHEYLKGTGPNEVQVVVRGDHTYLTAAEALEVAKQSVASRVTAWDNRQAVIFLEDTWEPYPAGGASASAATKALTFTYSSLHLSRFDYAIGELSRSWLPAASAATTTAAQSSGSVSFITDGAKSPPPVITLSDLKVRIAQIAAELNAAENYDEYALCIERKLSRERIKRADQRTGTSYVPPRYESTLESGVAAGVEAHRHRFPNLSTPRYNYYWLSGRDAAHFQAVIVDDDSNPDNGYYATLSTTRPLPASSLSVRINNQYFTLIPCNVKPDDAYRIVTVTVTAPAGTVHEAFFDPVYATSTGEYKADASLGVLKPAAYRKTGDTATTTIHSVAWKSQQATLTTSPGALPANHHVDFIELDGSVSLRLDVNTATTTTSGGKHTHAWRICQQPWHAGDKLMLRISQSGANLSGATNDAACTTPNPKPTPTPIATSTPVATSTPIATSTPVATSTPPVATSTPIATTTPPVATSTPVATPTPVAKPTPLAAPPQVSAFTVNTAGRGALTVSWKAMSGAAKYRLTLLVGIGEWRTISDNLTTTSYSATGLTCGQMYHYRISAYGDGRTYAAKWGPEADAWRAVSC